LLALQLKWGKARDKDGGLGKGDLPQAGDLHETLKGMLKDRQ
jgi:hypothetical protein